MASTHRGRLQNVEDPTIDLLATLTFQPGQVDIRSEGKTLGQWPLEGFSAEREEEDRFSLVIGGEPWIFAAENPSDFLVSSLDVMADPPRDGRAKRLFQRLGAAGITISAFSLAVATTLSAFAGGVIVGRNRLDDNMGVVIGAVLVIVGLSLIRIRAARRLSPPPSVAAQGLTQRPVQVTQIVPRRHQPTRTEPVSLILPRPLLLEQEEEEDHRQILARVPASKPSGGSTVSGVAHRGNSTAADDASHTTSETRPTTMIPDTVPASLLSHTNAGPTMDPEPGISTVVPDTAEAIEPTHVEGVEPATSVPAALTDPEPEDVGPGVTDLQVTDLDLSAIKGIGPALAARLTELGIRDISDLAKLDEDDVTLVVEYLGRFGVRLVSQDWVGQARRLIATD
jgi:predicted flap endonuclease-1-like 5' DNA nuclease